MDDPNTLATRLDLAMAVKNEGIWDWNLVTNETVFDDRYYTMVGYAPGEFPQDFVAWANHVHPDDLPHCDAAIQAYLSGKSERFDVEFRFQQKDGSWSWIQGRGKIVERDANGAPLRMIGTHTDITERKRAELSLRESERRFAQLIHNSFDTIVILDAEGIQRYVSASAERVHGYAPAELVDIPVIERMIHPEDQARVLAAFRNITVTGEESVQYRHRRKTGGWVHLEARGTNQLDNPDIRGVVVNVRDMTEHKRAEEEKEKLHAQLVQAQKMESVGRLAGGVAHDFNNMLGVILGHVELAMANVLPGDPLRTDLEEIQKAAERSAELTQQLLAFARKQTITPKLLDLNATIEGMLKLLGRLIGEDIQLLWLPGRDLWPVRLDPSQADQILANLCVNARDAIAGVGKITVETSTTTLDEAYCAQHAGFVPGDYVLLVVSDDGCGMDAETLSHLFEPFFTTKEVGEGTGLGLSSVYGAVKQNDGFICVDSEPGQGTTFRIHLPRDTAMAARATDERRPQSASHGSETILLVEDEPMILQLATKMLELLGYTVVAAQTPGEAILLAQEHPGGIDLLMTDVIMPEMNGGDLARNLLSIHPNLRRLFMSGYTANVIAHHGVLKEGVHFLEKPFSIKDLSEKVREALGNG
ncbi:MAG: PAS domain-containing protein [Myxococcota bacterium]|jgi:PAS domain S-box-containing protein|nr:PAS domain-containing protein [Myxococcota bacterium]